MCPCMHVFVRACAQVCLCACVHMCAGTCRAQKRAADFLELDGVKGTCESPDVGTGDNSALWKSSKCFQP